MMIMVIIDPYMKLLSWVLTMLTIDMLTWRRGVLGVDMAPQQWFLSNSLSTDINSQKCIYK